MRPATPVFALFLAVLTALGSVPGPAWAHGGGLDRKGCHDDRPAGGYHCHRGPLAGRTFTTKAESLGATRFVPIGPIAGKVNIIDGDTIRVAGREIRLFGISAPDIARQCNLQGRPFPCGQNAVFALSRIIETQWVHCREKRRSKKGVVFAVCNLAGPDGPEINRAMVRQGWAFADRASSSAYDADEMAARRAKAGLWAMEFVGQ